MKCIGFNCMNFNMCHYKTNDKLKEKGCLYYKTKKLEEKIEKLNKLIELHEDRYILKHSQKSLHTRQFDLEIYELNDRIRNMYLEIESEG